MCRVYNGLQNRLDGFGSSLQAVKIERIITVWLVIVLFIIIIVIIIA